MRAVLQRVKQGALTIDGKEAGGISQGLVVLVGFTVGDNQREVDYFADKIVNLRIFSDENDNMNLSALDVKGQLLVVSNFTLYADARKGRRPSFTDAARPEEATSLYNAFIKALESHGLPMITGEFGADMQVSLVNDGPVTIWLDSEEVCPRKDD